MKLSPVSCLTVLSLLWNNVHSLTQKINISGILWGCDVYAIFKSKWQGHSSIYALNMFQLPVLFLCLLILPTSSLLSSKLSFRGLAGLGMFKERNNLLTLKWLWFISEQILGIWPLFCQRYLAFYMGMFIAGCKEFISLEIMFKKMLNTES